MYAKFKWDFLNGKSKSHIDLTVGFNCIVCHIFKLFTNQHFNYSVCWQTLGQIKSSILKCHCQVCYPDITRLLLGRVEEWGNRANFLQWQETWQRESLGAAARAARMLPVPTRTLDSAGLHSASPWSCNWVSFEVDLFLIREIFPFMCLSPGCQVLFTWTVCVPGVPRPPPLVRYGDISKNLLRPRPQSAAFCLAFSPPPTSIPITAQLGKLSPGRWPWAASVWKEFL